MVFLEKIKYANEWTKKPNFLVKEREKKVPSSTLMGLEPTIFGSGGRRLIHQATGSALAMRSLISSTFKGQIKMLIFIKTTVFKYFHTSIILRIVKNIMFYIIHLNFFFFLNIEIRIFQSQIGFFFHFWHSFHDVFLINHGINSPVCPLNNTFFLESSM